MEIRLYNRQKLDAFINSDLFKRLPRIPISLHRAVSQINNPRASENDILLALMFENDNMVGYLGVLPDYIFYEGQPAKVGWLSCFWVDELYRSGTVAVALFLRIMEVWEERILITNFVPSLATLYRMSGMFMPVKIKTGMRAYLRLNLSEILPPKSRWLSELKPLLRLSDFVFNSIADLRFCFFHAYSNPVQYGFLSDPDSVTRSVIETHIGVNLPARKQSEIGWILKYPWILEGSEDSPEARRYYFSSFSKRFFYRILILYDDKRKVSGMALINVRNNHLTIPYIFANHGFETLAGILTDYMIELKVNMITTFDPRLMAALRKLKKAFLFQKEIIKPFFISKKLSFIDKLDFQDGDGDCAFY